MSAIGPGDFVECVSTVRGDDDPNDFLPNKQDGEIIKGQIYRVRQIQNTVFGDGLLLVEQSTVTVDRDGDERSWSVECFRPIYRPKSSFIEALKQPAPAEPERVTA